MERKRRAEVKKLVELNATKVEPQIHELGPERDSVAAYFSP
jgi:hypothetical protein